MTSLRGRGGSKDPYDAFVCKSTFCKWATNYRALLQQMRHWLQGSFAKMTHNDKASHGSSLTYRPFFWCWKRRLATECTLCALSVLLYSTYYIQSLLNGVYAFRVSIEIVAIVQWLRVYIQWVTSHIQTSHVLNTNTPFAEGEAKCALFHRTCSIEGTHSYPFRYTRFSSDCVYPFRYTPLIL